MEGIDLSQGSICLYRCHLPKTVGGSFTPVDVNLLFL